MSDKNLSVFVDGIGRTVVGELAGETDDVLDIKNPAVIHVVPNQQTGQISVQLIPLFFKEFAKQGTDDGVTWGFKKATLAVASNLELDNKLVQQYTNMYSPIATPNSGIVTPGDAAPAGGDQAKVVKLFDD